MAYLGNKPVNNFVSFAKQDITGNGGTSYSLDYPVTGANDIDLFINNVRQEPTEAYSCSGSTLTLTEAVSSSDDIYAIFRGRALQTAQHPSDSALEASQATISGSTVINGTIGVNNSSPSYQVDITRSTGGTDIMRVKGDSHNAFIRFQDSDSSSDFTVGSDDNGPTGSGSFVIYDRNASSYRWRMDSSGRVTMPYQPVFSYLGTKTHDIVTTSTQVMSASNVWSNNVIHALNRGSHFNSSTGRFTAPITGTYHFQFQCTYDAFNSGYLYFYMNINGTTKSTMQADQQTPQSAIVNHMYCELSANDYVDVSWTNNYASGNIKYPGFSGMLVG